MNGVVEAVQTSRMRRGRAGSGFAKSKGVCIHEPTYDIGSVTLSPNYSASLFIYEVLDRFGVWSYYKIII